MNMPALTFVKPSVLPGFGLTLGFTLFYLSVIVLIPLSTLFISSMQLPWEEFWEIITTQRALHAYSVSFGISLAAALSNCVIGLVIAWVLVRYHFPGKRLMDAMVDLPFALPTAVAGIALATLYAPDGWVGRLFAPLDISIAFTPLGIYIALVFVGLPFVVRTVEPVLEDVDAEVEEAAVSLGATRWQTFTRVLFPSLLPAMLTGFAMAFARGLGEYGAVIFIAGNIPYVSEIAPLLIVIKLEQYDITGATSVALVMLMAAFVLLLIINRLQHWAGIKGRKH